MSDFQEQAKNWLRNVVKQNPDKIKTGVDKAGDLVDKHTGGKYAEKVDAVQQKVGDYVDGSQSPAETADAGGVPSPAGGVDPETTGEAPEATSEAPEAATDTAESAEDAAESGSEVVGGEAPDPSAESASSAGSTPEGAQTGSTVTGQSSSAPKPGPPPGAARH